MDCTSEIQHVKIVLQDRDGGRSKIYFSNPKKRKVKKMIVDDCLIKEGKRCDYMLLDHKTIEYYIELKGKEVAYACAQIEETIKKLSLNKSKAQKYAFIVSTSCPLTTASIQVLKAGFKKRYNGVLFVKNNMHEHCID
jgi:hypothetical protein